jgi:RNA polymerase sigma factor (sigma-70 family)
MNDTASEAQLLRASATGSKEAFGLVVRRYQALVCSLTYSATGDVGASEELAQETFIRAWTKLRQLEDPGRFRAWLCTIARNLANTWLRSRRASAAHSLDAAAEQPAVGPAPDEAASAKERQEIVWAAVGGLPSKYREPLVLFYRRQRSVEQVAADLGLSEDVVRQRLHRGRLLIKTEVSSLVEDTLARSGPGKAFAVAVVAALPAVVTPTASAAVVGIAAKGAPATQTTFAAALSGAILGPILGLLGGVLGTWCGIRNTSSPRERRFMIRMAVLVWLLLFALVGIPLTLMLVGLIPRWAYWSCFTAFFVLLLPLILWSNAHQRRIQIEEGTFGGPEHALTHTPRPGVHGGFAGPIFGGTLWLLILTVLAGDWLSFAVIVGCDLLLLVGATALHRRSPQRYWSVALLTVCTLMAVTLSVVNLRWTAWMHAYRQSTAYDPRNDVSLTTINMILLGLLAVLLVLFAARSFRSRTPQHGPTPGRHQ